MLYKDTHMLLVPKPTGDKFNTAIRYDTSVVNLNWLRDALLCNQETFANDCKDERYRNRIQNLFYILFPTKINLENEGNLYSASSNPTNVVLVIVLGMIIRKGA